MSSRLAARLPTLAVAVAIAYAALPAAPAARSEPTRTQAPPADTATVAVTPDVAQALRNQLHPLGSPTQQ